MHLTKHQMRLRVPYRSANALSCEDAETAPTCRTTAAGTWTQECPIKRRRNAISMSST